MIGKNEPSQTLLSCVNLEDRVTKNEPMRKMREVLNEALADLGPGFQRLYSTRGRPSIPPERLIRASLLQALFSVRSELCSDS